MLGPNTNLNAFEQFRDDLPGRAIALVTQSGHQGRPVFQGQEIGIRLSHWAPVGNEADLEIGRLRRLLLRPPRHRRHGLLRRGLQERAHPPAGRRPGRTPQGAGGGGQGRADQRGHLDGQGPHRAPHRFGRRRLGRLPPVRGDPGGRARPAPGGGGHPGPDEAPPRPRRSAGCAGARWPGLRVLHLGRHRRPHGRPGGGGRPGAAPADQGDPDPAPRVDPARTCGSPTRSTTGGLRCATGAGPRSSRPSCRTPTSTSSCARSPGPCPRWPTSSPATWSTPPPRPTSRCSSSGVRPSGDEDGLPRDPARQRRAHLPHLHQRRDGHQGVLRPPPLRQPATGRRSPARCCGPRRPPPRRPRVLAPKGRDTGRRVDALGAGLQSPARRLRHRRAQGAGGAETAKDAVQGGHGASATRWS